MNDVLIKNNIVKKNKIIVDIGEHSIKVLNVKYAAKNINITSAEEVDATGIFSDEEMNASELAKRVDEVAMGSGRKDISVTLPSEMTINKIVSLKNKKESEIPKIIAKEHSSFNGISKITHVIDYAYIGKRDEQGDTVHYCIVSAVKKSLVNELIKEFAEYKMRVTTVSSGAYTGICLSELFYDEYEHLNRILIDFGAKATRITAFSSGIAVYTRTLNIGFDTYKNKLFTGQENAGKPEIEAALLNVGSDSVVLGNAVQRYFSLLNMEEYFKTVNEIENEVLNEIMRVIDLCQNNDVAISKIYYTGFVLKGFDKKLQRTTELNCEKIKFKEGEEKQGRGYMVEIGAEEFGQGFSNALGLCIYPMQPNKKINLLPLDVQNKYINKYIFTSFALIGGVLILALVFRFANIGFTSWQIKKIEAENQEYNNKKTEIEKIEKSLARYNDFKDMYEKGFFPFDDFMNDIEKNRPATVSILSVDTPDRLINEGKQEDKEESKDTDLKDTESKADESKKDESEKKTEEPAEKTETEEQEKPDDTTIKYEKDLSGQTIVIRGYGSSQDDISRYIYNLSKLPYIADVNVTAIEEHEIENGRYNIFEITVKGV